LVVGELFPHFLVFSFTFELRGCAAQAYIITSFGIMLFTSLIIPPGGVSLINI
jgi:hypothetical protein